VDCLGDFSRDQLFQQFPKRVGGCCSVVVVDIVLTRPYGALCAAHVCLHTTDIVCCPGSCGVLGRCGHIYSFMGPMRVIMCSDLVVICSLVLRCVFAEACLTRWWLCCGGCVLHLWFVCMNAGQDRIGLVWAAV
jgi:hypothetical protein